MNVQKVSVVGLSALVVCLGLTSSAYASFTAYNDNSGSSPGNVTSYNPGQSGLLKDYATGIDVGVTATVTTFNGAFAAGGGYNFTNSASEGYQVFNGKVDMVGVIQYGSSGWWEDVTFTGLDPSLRYEVVTTADRGSSSAYWDRWTRFTISGHDSATYASSSDVPDQTYLQKNSEESTSFCVGKDAQRDTWGYIAQWTNINPGADGAFKVRSENELRTDLGGDYKSYGTQVFRLIEVGGDPPPPPPDLLLPSGYDKIVSIAISDGTHPVGNGAGRVAANNWNNLNYGGGAGTTFSGLVDNTGAGNPATLRVKSGDRRAGATGANVDVNTDLFYGYTATVATDNLPNKNFAFGPGSAYLLENLNEAFPNGYDLILYTEMWSFSTGTGGQVVVDDNDARFITTVYNGHGPPWTGNVANLDFLMSNPAYDGSTGFIEGQNYLKLLNRTEDVLSFQPYPYFGPVFNSIGITGIQILHHVPEPSAFVLAAVGLLGLLACAWRRRG